MALARRPTASASLHGSATSMKPAPGGGRESAADPAPQWRGHELAHRRQARACRCGWSLRSQRALMTGGSFILLSSVSRAEHVPPRRGRAGGAAFPGDPIRIDRFVIAAPRPSPPPPESHYPQLQRIPTHSGASRLCLTRNQTGSFIPSRVLAISVLFEPGQATVLFWDASSLSRRASPRPGQEPVHIRIVGHKHRPRSRAGP